MKSLLNSNIVCDQSSFLKFKALLNDDILGLLFLRVNIKINNIYHIPK